MVSYQKFVSLFFAETDATSRDEATDTLAVAAQVWSDNKEELKTATVQETKQALRNL